jgi:hypothetical protein
MLEPLLLTGVTISCGLYWAFVVPSPGALDFSLQRPTFGSQLVLPGQFVDIVESSSLSFLEKLQNTVTGRYLPLACHNFPPAPTACRMSCLHVLVCQDASQPPLAPSIIDRSAFLSGQHITSSFSLVTERIRFPTPPEASPYPSCIHLLSRQLHILPVLVIILPAPAGSSIVSTSEVTATGLGGGGGTLGQVPPAVQVPTGCVPTTM